MENDPPEPYELPTETALICGSRSLVDVSGGERWGRYLIECILDHADSLFIGDADGPDTWAREKAARLSYLRATTAVYCLDGTVRDADLTQRVSMKGELAYWTDPENVPRDRDDPRWKKWPLKRNEAMIRALCVRRRRERDRRFGVHALIDPRSRTQGSMHTALLARKYHFPTWVEELTQQHGALQFLEEFDPSGRIYSRK